MGRTNLTWSVSVHLEKVYLQFKLQESTDLLTELYMLKHYKPTLGKKKTQLTSIFN